LSASRTRGVLPEDENGDAVDLSAGVAAVEDVVAETTDGDA
jgi:hypothetical protein